MTISSAGAAADSAGAAADSAGAAADSAGADVASVELLLPPHADSTMAPETITTPSAEKFIFFIELPFNFGVAHYMTEGGRLRPRLIVCVVQVFALWQLETDE